ncbi:MAG: response regulator [Clostridia bacterium]|nr:response regulator [Clostridia bacterium]
MKNSLPQILKQKRKEMGLTQEMLAQKLFVSKSAVSYWEKGTRMPDAEMMVKIAKCLDVDISVLMSDGNEIPNVIIVDDEKIILNGGIPIIKSVIPNAEVTGFTKPSDAVQYAKNNKVDLAFLDIEMGMTSGLDVCKDLLECNPKTNVIYLTAYSEYSLDAWKTGASGFMLKPLTADGIREELSRLRYPIWGIVEQKQGEMVG